MKGAVAKTRSALAAEVYCMAEHQLRTPIAFVAMTRRPLRSNHSPRAGMVWRAKAIVAARKIVPVRTPRQKASASMSPPMSRITSASGTKIITPASVTRTPKAWGLRVASEVIRRAEELGQEAVEPVGLLGIGLCHQCVLFRPGLRAGFAEGGPGVGLPAAEAFALAERFEFYYTPKAASWLNMIEIEFSALSRECLNRRIPTLELLAKEVLALVKERAAKKIKINWQFSIKTARTKLNRHYQQVNADNSKYKKT